MRRSRRPSSQRASGRAAVSLLACWVAFVPLAVQAEPPADLLAKCAACHGPGGNSVVPQFPSIAAQPATFIENQLVLMREGLREVPAMMPIVDGMKDEQITALAKHFAALPAKPGAAEAAPDKAKLGAEIARARLCSTCHLADYAGQQQVPRIGGQNEPYLLESMKAFRDHPGPGRDTIMASTLRGLTDADLAGLANYLAGFEKKP